MRTAFPRQRVVKLNYRDLVTIDAPGGVYFADYYYRANSCFDPDYTGTGHQPMGYDQWTQFYNTYTVIGAKISVQGAFAASGSIPAVFGVRTLDASSTSLTTLSALMESPTVHWKFVQAITNGNMPRAATATYSAKKWYNVAQIKDNQDRLGAAVGANPTLDTYFQMFVGAVDATNNLPACWFTVAIQYIVLFSDPKELGQS